MIYLKEGEIMKRSELKQIIREVIEESKEQTTTDRNARRREKAAFDKKIKQISKDVVSYFIDGGKLPEDFEEINGGDSIRINMEDIISDDSGVIGSSKDRLHYFQVETHNHIQDFREKKTGHGVPEIGSFIFLTDNAIKYYLK
jgi:hypothetical protein